MYCIAITAAEGLVITSANTTNAYQQSLPPTQKCYMMIDDTFHSWYNKWYSKDMDPKTHVVPLKRAMQGHPEASALWESMIVGILEGDELKFKSMTHECNLYCSKIDGKVVLVCHQVNDFMITLRSTATAEKLIAIINRHATISSKGIGVSSSQGISLQYNGVHL